MEDSTILQKLKFLGKFVKFTALKNFVLYGMYILGYKISKYCTSLASMSTVCY